VRVDKEFLGRPALLTRRAQAEPGDARRLRCLTLDDPRVVCLGSEPVRIDGTVCGRVTSGGYGYRVSASIAYAYVPSTVVTGTTAEVGVFGEWHAAVVRDEPLYDPNNARVRA